MQQFNSVSVAALIAVVFLIAILFLGYRQYQTKGKRTKSPVSFDAGMEGAKLLKDWCMWLATISGLAISASGLLATKCSATALAVLSIAAFVAAIICTATLLLALPSVIGRFVPGEKATRNGANDLYESKAYLWVRVEWVAPYFRVGFIAALQYLCFLCGVLTFAIYVAVRTCC